MDSQSSVLIIARSDQMRNSLKVLVQSSPLVQSVLAAGNIRLIEGLDGGKKPALVLLALCPQEPDFILPLMEIKTRWPNTPVILLADNDRQVTHPASPGPEVVLVKGVLAASLLAVVERLISSI